MPRRRHAPPGPSHSLPNVLPPSLVLSLTPRPSAAVATDHRCRSYRRFLAPPSCPEAPLRLPRPLRRAKQAVAPCNAVLDAFFNCRPPWISVAARRRQRLPRARCRLFRSPVSLPRWFPSSPASPCAIAARPLEPSSGRPREPRSGELRRPRGFPSAPLDADEPGLRPSALSRRPRGL